MKKLTDKLFIKNNTTMGRIKQGLEYFPLSTNFMHDRIVRRV